MKRVVGITNGVTLKLGDWSGIVSFTLMPMDDFEVVLGKESLRKKKVMTMLHLDCFAIF